VNSFTGDLRFSATAARARHSAIADLMVRALVRPGTLSLAAGFTDNAVLPVSIVRDALAHMPAGGGCLQYGSNQGRPTLREAIAAHIGSQHGERPDAVGADGIVMTNGSQQALYLLAQVLCNPGDIVLVESPTYFVVFDVLAGLGIEAVELPMDAAGQVDVAGTGELFERLRAEGRLERVKMAYFITYFSNPSAVSMTEGVKRALGSLVAQHVPWLVTIEDTAYRDLYFSRPYPAASMLSLGEWTGLPLVQTGSFSKCFSPGIRLGFFATNVPALVEKTMCVKGQQDFGSANISQWIAEFAMTRGLFDPFVAGLRVHYQAKAKALDDALGAGGLKALGWRWEMPEGGLMLWLKGPTGLDTGMTGAFCRACMDSEVLYVPGDFCYANAASAPRCNVRLSIGAPPVEDLREAARRFALAAQTVLRG
jgi:2-aminoadipate transaminase